MALEYPDCLGAFRAGALEVHTQIERLALARYNQRAAQEERHVAELTAATTKLRDVLEVVDDYALNRHGTSEEA